MRRAASRAACTAGSSSAMRSPMMAMTTRTSINVKPGLCRRNMQTCAGSSRLLPLGKTVRWRDGPQRPSGGGRSIGVGGNELALAPRAEGPDDGNRRARLEQADRAVDQGDVGAARVVAAQAVDAGGIEVLGNPTENLGVG